jgi:type II secretory pathway pseudopilin PulG
MKAPRALTLVEVLVALTINAIVLSTVVVLFAGSAKRAAIARTHNALARDGAALADLLRRELGRAGLGMPRGPRVDDATALFDTSLLLAGTTEIGVVADLPRPDSSHATMSLLSGNVVNDEGGAFDSSRSLFFFNESNGNCQPDGLLGTGATCSTAASSTFFPGREGCKVGSLASDRTCPWSLGRLVDGERFVVVLGDGHWLQARNETPLAFDASHHLVLLKTAAPLDPNWSLSKTHKHPLGVSGPAYVATVDRLFFAWSPETRKVERIQCFDEAPAPTDPAYGTGDTTTLPSFTAARCTATPTHREVVARHVESLAFTYFDAAGASVGTAPLPTAALKASVRRVDFRIVFKDEAHGEEVRYELTGAVPLEQ